MATEFNVISVEQAVAENATPSRIRAAAKWAAKESAKDRKRDPKRSKRLQAQANALFARANELQQFYKDIV